MMIGSFWTRRVLTEEKRGSKVSGMNKGLRRTAAVCLFVLLLCPSMRGAVAEYKAYHVTETPQVDRKKVIVPIGKRLYDLGYFKNVVASDGQPYFDTRIYAAMNLFSQVMQLPYEDGVISVLAQEVLASDDAKPCPISMPGSSSHTRKLFDDETKVDGEVWFYATIDDMNMQGGSYEITASGHDAESNRIVKVYYTLPDYAPQLLVGDEVLVLGKLIEKGPSKTYTVQASLIAFSAAQ